MALLHTVFSAECNNIFDWHSIALFRSHNVSGQVGGITRLLACSKEQLKTYHGLDIGPTFVHPNHRADEGMNYAAFNKPASINYFVHSTALPKDVKYIMQLDADMLIHRPLDPEALGVAPGVVLSAPYDYLVGTTSGLADVFQVKNQQHLARVGGVHVFHIDDIKRIAPLWLNFTERVREFSCRDPERYYELASPDADRKDQSEEALGRRRQFMWMVEMYGYVFGAAHAGIEKHIVSGELMRYTGDVLKLPGPYVIHYGIDWEVKWKDRDGFDRHYSFNKLLYLGLDAASCPRWFFPLPPYADEIPGDLLSGKKNYRDALCGRQIAEFNAALCEYYHRHCMVHPRCPPVSAEHARKHGLCVDLNQNCLSWARKGECTSNPGWMKEECAQSCGACAEQDAPPLLGRPESTCIDTAPSASCESLVHLNACTTQRPYMLEACRRSCHFCNASADAFGPKGEDERDDTAAHACPDGSDLGGGKVIVASKDPKLVALQDGLLDEQTDQPDQLSPNVGQRRTAARNDVVSLRDDTHEHLALDAAMASWPFFLVQGLMLLATGYFLRGFIDRRARSKRLQVGVGGRTQAMRH